MKTARTRLRGIKRGNRRRRESPACERVETENKGEVATKPFAYWRPLKDVFDYTLSSRIPIAPRHHVPNFPDRVARAVVLAREDQFM